MIGFLGPSIQMWLLFFETSMPDMLETDAACQKTSCEVECQNSRVPEQSIRFVGFWYCVIVLFLWISQWSLFLVHVWSLLSRVIPDVWLRSACGKLGQFYCGYESNDLRQ